VFIIIFFLFVLLLLSFNMFCRSLVQAIRCLESAKEKRLSEVGQEQPPPAVQQQEERLEGPNPSPPAPTLASTASSSSSTSMKNVAVAGTF